MRFFTFYFLSFLFPIVHVSASHLTGGEISVDHLGGTNYEVTVAVHYDYSGTVALPPQTVNLTVFRRDSPVLISTQGINITSIDSTTNYKCGTTFYDFGTAYYIDTISFSPNTYNHPGGYLLTVDYGPGATNANLATNANQIYSLMPPTTFAPPNVFVNNSPDFNPFTTFVLCPNELFSHDFGATDPDGDSIAYKLFTPARSGNPSQGLIDSMSSPYPNPKTQFNTITWVNGYSENTQIKGALPDSAQNKLRFDVETGLLTVTPDSNYFGIFTAGLAYEEYRDINNDGSKEFIGAVYRVLSFNILQNCSWYYHTAPELSYSQNIISIPSAGWGWDSDTLFYENNEIQIPVYVIDADSSAEIEIIASSASLSGSEISVDQTVDSLFSPTDTLFASLILDISNSNLGRHKIQVVALNDQCDNVLSDTIEFWVEVDINSSLKNEAEDNHWHVYPSPTNDEVNIFGMSLDHKPTAYRLIDIHGKVYLTGNFTSKKLILDVGALPTGIYFVNLLGSVQENHKIIVQH